MYLGVSLQLRHALAVEKNQEGRFGLGFFLKPQTVSLEPSLYGPLCKKMLPPPS